MTYTVEKADFGSNRWYVTGDGGPFSDKRWLVLKLRTKRAAGLLADILNTGELTRDQTESLIRDIPTPGYNYGRVTPRQYAIDTIASVCVRCGLKPPEWWSAYRAELESAR